MGEPIRSYEDLAAWQKSYDLVLEVFRVTAMFPRDERFGLTQQIRRAAVSIPSHVAEGWGRGASKEFRRFLSIARGSAYELQTQLRLTRDLDMVADGEEIVGLLRRVGEVERIVNGLIRSIKLEDQR